MLALTISAELNGSVADQDTLKTAFT